MNQTLFDQPTEAQMSTDLVEHKATTPMDLLAVAVENNLDPDRLGKLMDLQERWERNQAEKAYAVAMHAAQQAMPKVHKGSKNSQTGSTYAALEDVQSVARPVYSAHGFSMNYGEGDCPVEKFKRTVCDVRHVGGHCVRYHLDLPIDGVGAKGNAIGNMNPVQACISTTSYGQRRLCCMIWNITLSDEDDDGQAGATITEEQIATLNEWIESTNADVPRFLSWLGVEKLSQISAQQFPNALRQLKRKAGKQ